MPLREIGALLDAHAVHPGRSARDHLRWIAASNGIPTTRVDEVLDLVGLTRWPASGPAGSRWAWPSDSASRAPCSATRRCCSWTSR